MMWGYGSNMMNWGGGFGLFGFLVSIFWIVILIDLILLGIYLWKQIRRK